MRKIKVLTSAAVLFAAINVAQLLQAVPLTGSTGPGGFTTTGPTSNITLWLRGDAGVTKNVSDQVANWADQSGHGADVNQTGADALKPLQNTMLNGVPIITFDGNGAGSPDHLNFTSSTVSARSIYFVGQTTGLGNGGGPDTVLGGAPSFPAPSIRRNDANKYRGNTNTDSNDFTFAGGSEFFINGDLNDVVGHGVNHIANAVRGGSATSLGANRNLGLHNTDRAWHGTLGEFIVFQSLPNSVQKVLIDNYLSSKFDIALDSGDKYSGDTSARLHHDYNVFGIGSDGTSTVTNAGSNGFGIEANAGAASSDLNVGEWIMAGHVDDTNIVTPLSGDFLGSRWQRTWYVDTNGSSLAATLGFNFDDAGIGGMFNLADSFSLLYADPDSPNEWVILSYDYLLGPGNVITFALDEGQFLDGYYTLGVNAFGPVPEPSTMLMLAMGMLGMARQARRRNRKA